jgi:hypothetical protein
VLRGQHAAKLDVVTAARNLHAAEGRLHVAGAAHELTLDGVTRTDARLLPTTAADNQIAKKLDIPPQYLRRVREHHLGLYDANVNGWLAHDPQRRFLVRGLAAGEGETGVMRALLSDQFRIVDNLDVLMSALDGIRQAGAQVDITSADLTETRMYVIICTRQERVGLRGYWSRSVRPAFCQTGRTSVLMRVDPHAHCGWGYPRCGRANAR